MARAVHKIRLWKEPAEMIRSLAFGDKACTGAAGRETKADGMITDKDVPIDAIATDSLSRALLVRIDVMSLIIVLTERL